jgi:hypothetical protein
MALLDLASSLVSTSEKPGEISRAQDGSIESSAK